MLGPKRFKDRAQAGHLLATRLQEFSRRKDVMVLALPRGGVPVGHAVAKALGLPLDILSVRKLGLPRHAEFAMGAIAAGGEWFFQLDVVKQIDISMSTIEAIAQRELREVERRDKLYRANRPPLQLRDRTVILIDDGLATGSTMAVAVQAARKAHPARLIIAIPVAPADSLQKLNASVDEIICLRTPNPFLSVGTWYEDFTQITDAEVIVCLNEMTMQNQE